MTQNRRPLIIPPAADADDNAIEMARIWIAQGKLHCVLNIGHWHRGTDIDERHAWGIVLADFARHASMALADTMDTDAQDNLTAILDSFKTEIRRRTSDHDGEWPHGKP